MLLAVHILVQAGFIVRVLLRAHRDPASRIAWIAAILALPVVGVLAYLLLGETNIGRKRIERMKEVMAALPDIASTPGFDAPAVRPQIPERHLPLFQVGRSVSGFEPVGGNHARLMADFERRDRRDGARYRPRRRSCSCLVLYLDAGRQRPQDGRSAQARGRPRGDLPCDGRRPRVAPPHQIGSLDGYGGGRRETGPGAQGRQSALAGLCRTDRSSRPSQDRRHRQQDHLLRQSELRGPGIPHQSEIRSLGGRGHAVHGPGRPAKPAPLFPRLDGLRE